MRRIAVAALAAATLVLCAACSGSSEDGGDDAAGAEGTPSAGARASALPGTEPPAGFVEHTLGGVTFAAPGDMEPVGLGAATQGTEELGLRVPAPQGTLSAAVLAQVVAQPERDAAAEADSLETIKRDVEGAEGVSRQELDLQGFSTAVVVSYSQQGPDGARTRTDQLVADLRGGGLLSLTVAAPVDDFESDRLASVLRTATAG